MVKMLFFSDTLVKYESIQIYDKRIIQSIHKFTKKII